MEENLEGDYYIVEHLDEELNYSEDQRDTLEDDGEFEELEEQQGEHFLDTSEKSLKVVKLDKKGEKLHSGVIETMGEIQSEEMESEDQEMEQLEMVVESDDSSGNLISACDIGNKDVEKSSTNNEKLCNDETGNTRFTSEPVVIKQKENQTARKSFNRVVLTPSTNSTITMTAGNKVVTMKGSKVPSGTKYVLNHLKGNVPKVLVTSNKPTKENSSTEASPVKDSKENKEILSQEMSSSSGAEFNEKTNTSPKADGTVKKSCISTHVVDTSKGYPIGGLQVSLYKLVDGRWTFLNESSTMPSGRCNDLVDHDKMNFTTGRYKLHFDVDKYFTCRKIETMYPFIEIVFDVKNPAGQYHIPMLLSPYGYTTYRGSER